EAGDAELHPEAHDLEDFGLDLGVGGVEVGLEFVEAMEVVFACFFVPGPGGFLYAGEDDAAGGVLWFGFRPDVPVAIGRVGRTARGFEPGVLVGGGINDEGDEEG